MKKLLIFTLAIFAFVAFASAQKVHTLDVDTLQGAETVSFGTFSSSTSTKVITVQALSTQLGGTSDGTLALYGSVDGTSYSFINGVGADILTASPKASITGADLNQITITDALVATWVVRESPFNEYELVGVGTVGDTTKVNIVWTAK